MPIYEYACGSCEHRFETIQRASDVPLRDCPECGEAALKKLLSAPVFRLKGGGWYETDFKTGDKRNVSDAGDGAAQASGEGKGKEESGAAGSGKTDKNGGQSKSEPKKAETSSTFTSKGGEAKQSPAPSKG